MPILRLILKGDQELIKNELEKAVPNNKTLADFPTSDFEIRAEEFVRRAKEDPK